MIINVPPDDDPRSIGSDTQLNLFDGGQLREYFEAGAYSGPNSNIEINFYGGIVGHHFHANQSTSTNVYGGNVGQYLRAVDCTVNIHGGTVDRYFNVWNTSVVNVHGGFVDRGFETHPDATVNINGGIIESIDVGPQSTTNFRGAVLGNIDSDLTSFVNFFGGEFELSGLGVGYGNANMSVDSILSGTLSDGSVFITDYTPATITLVEAEIPSIEKTEINVPGDPVPNGLRHGQTLNLSDGGELGNHFRAVNAIVNLIGGNVGNDFDFAGSEVVVDGAEIGFGMDAFLNSRVHIVSGSVGNHFYCHDGTVATIAGGTFGTGFGAYPGSEVTVFDGIFDIFYSVAESSLHISGGKFSNHLSCSGETRIDSGVFHELRLYGDVMVSGGAFGNQFEANAGSNVNLVGSRFLLKHLETGQQLVEDLTPANLGEKVIVEARDRTLEIVFADGSALSYDLYSSFLPDRDFCDPAAELSLWLSANAFLDSFDLIHGFQFGGDIGDLNASDDSRLILVPGFPRVANEPPILLVVDATLPSETPNNLRLMLESQANTLGIMESIELWNWSNGEFDEVRFHSANLNVDSQIVVDLTGEMKRVH